MLLRPVVDPRGGFQGPGGCPALVVEVFGLTGVGWSGARVRPSTGCPRPCGPFGFRVCDERRCFAWVFVAFWGAASDCLRAFEVPRSVVVQLGGSAVLCLGPGLHAVRACWEWRHGPGRRVGKRWGSRFVAPGRCGGGGASVGGCGCCCGLGLGWTVWWPGLGLVGVCLPGLGLRRTVVGVSVLRLWSPVCGVLCVCGCVSLRGVVSPSASEFLVALSFFLRCIRSLVRSRSA